jgi:hypothetical protein
MRYVSDIERVHCQSDTENDAIRGFVHDWNSFTYDDVGMFHSQRFESKTITQLVQEKEAKPQLCTMVGYRSTRQYNAVLTSLDFD